MSEKHKKACRGLNYFENFLVFISAASGCVSISTFASLVGAPVGTTNEFCCRIKNLCNHCRH